MDNDNNLVFNAIESVERCVCVCVCVCESVESTKDATLRQELTASRKEILFMEVKEKKTSEWKKCKEDKVSRVVQNKGGLSNKEICFDAKAQQTKENYHPQYKISQTID